MLRTRFSSYPEPQHDSTPGTTITGESPVTGTAESLLECKEKRKKYKQTWQFTVADSTSRSGYTKRQMVMKCCVVFVPGGNKILWNICLLCGSLHLITDEYQWRSKFATAWKKHLKWHKKSSERIPWTNFSGTYFTHHRRIYLFTKAAPVRENRRTLRRSKKSDIFKQAMNSSVKKFYSFSSWT